MKRILLLAALLLLLSPCARAEGQLTLLQDENGQTFVLDEHGELFGQANDYAALTLLTPEAEQPALYAAARADSPASRFLMNGEGEALTEASYSRLEYDGGYLIFWQGDKCGVMSLDGRELTEARYTWLMHIEDDRFFAYRSDHLDDTADELYLLSLSEGETDAGLYIGYGPEQGDGLYAAYDPRTRLFGYLNGQGEWAIDPAFDWAGAFADGRAVATQDGVPGLIDVRGEWIIPPDARFRSLVQVPGEGMLAWVTTEEGVCLYSGEDGGLLREYGVGVASVTPSGYSVVYLNDAVVLIDPAGQEVTRFEADCLIDLTQGDHCLVRQAGAWGTECEWVCSLATGETLSGPYQQVDFLTAVGEVDYFLCAQFETVAPDESSPARGIWTEVEGTRRWGIVSATGETLLPIEYERIVLLSDDLLAVKKDGQWSHLPLPAAE